MALIDPSAGMVMQLSSELMNAQAVIRRQRRRIALLAAALRASQQSEAALAEVLALVLEDERHA